ncbi:MAG: chemotaxis protein CheC [Parcubacteria group bacterium]|nr:chemotaxis protein CheC [Parcubacteria group bacterium]
MEPILTNLHKDELVEIINIGASKAATALSNMIGGRKVVIQVPEVFVDHPEKVPAFVDNLQKVETVVLLKFLGDTPGVMIFSFEPKSALKLASFLTSGHKEQLPVLDEFDRSALKEAGNVLSGAVVSSLSSFLNLNIQQSVPDTATDMFGSIIDAIIVEMSEHTNEVLVFRVNFGIIDTNNIEISGQMIFMFEPQATTKIIEALKIKFPNI